MFFCFRDNGKVPEPFPCEVDGGLFWEMRTSAAVDMPAEQDVIVENPDFAAVTYAGKAAD